MCVYTQRSPCPEETRKLLESLIPSAVIKSILLYPVLPSCAYCKHVNIAQPSEPRKLQAVKILVRYICDTINAIQRRRLSSYYSFTAIPLLFLLSVPKSTFQINATLVI